MSTSLCTFVTMKTGQASYVFPHIDIPITITIDAYSIETAIGSLSHGE